MHKTTNMKRQREIFVFKSYGKSVHYDGLKLKLSLQKSRAKDKGIQAILAHVDEMIYDGITTKEIYKIAFKL